MALKLSAEHARQELHWVVIDHSDKPPGCKSSPWEQQGRAEQSRAGQGRAEQGRAEQSRAGQSDVSA